MIISLTLLESRSYDLVGHFKLIHLNVYERNTAFSCQTIMHNHFRLTFITKQLTYPYEHVVPVFYFFVLLQSRGFTEAYGISF